MKSIKKCQPDLPDGKESRTRSLNLINDIFKATGGPEVFLSDLIKKRTPLDVLEIGFGWGHALLELVWKYRKENVTFYGIDLENKPELENQEGIINVAREFDVFPQSEITDIELPKLFFYDATNLHFADESMDFIYSAVTIRFIKQKAEVLQEISRVLKPGGVALLHFGESYWNYPYSQICDDRILTPYTNRFVLKHGIELIPLPIYVKLFEGECFRFQFTREARCIIILTKIKSGRLDLSLDYNEDLSMFGRRVPLKNRKGEVRGGYRSVYDVRTEHYNSLFEKGLLSNDQLHTDMQIIGDC